MGHAAGRGDFGVGQPAEFGQQEDVTVQVWQLLQRLVQSGAKILVCWSHRLMPLVQGDVLLLKGEWGVLEENLEDLDVLVVDEPADVRRQSVPLGPARAVRR